MSIEQTPESTLSSLPAPAPDDETPQSSTGDRGVRFWLIVVGLMLAAVMSAVDGTIVSTALPTIVNELNVGPNYVWVVNIYFLTTAAFQPLFGQLSDLWGRRWIFIGTVAIFVLGSGLCGGATSSTMLIAARGVQGVGAGGINMMADLIICDLVPLRERGTYIGLVFGVATTVAALGPLIGGALTDAGQWRWIFYLNLPLGAVCLGVMVLWLRVSHTREGTFVDRLRRIDWIGTVIMAASTVAVLYAIAYGGSAKPWSHPSIVAPLVVGNAGLLLFLTWEAMPQCKEPLVPLHLFANRTSAAAFFLTLTNCLIGLWVVYVFPIYFQAVLATDPKQSGIRLLPLVFGYPFASAFSGHLMAKTGRYRPIHMVGFALCTLACGLCSILDENSQTALWIVFEIILAFGIASPIACLLSAVQVELTDKDNASSTGAWAFIRSFGTIWGVAIPAAVFNDRFEQLLYTIPDEGARAILGAGQAYSQAPVVLANSFSSAVRSQIVRVYALSLQRTWHICIIFAGVSFLVTFFEKEVVMRKQLDTDFGLENKKTEEN